MWVLDRLLAKIVEVNSTCCMVFSGFREVMNGL